MIEEKNKNLDEIFGVQKALIEKIFAGVCVIDSKDLTIKYVSFRFEEMLGYSSVEFINRDASTIGILVDKKTHRIAKEVNTAIKKNGYWRGEIKNIKKDGTEIYSDVKCWFLKHPVFGDVLFCLYLDITKQKQYEAKLLERTKELEREKNVLSDIVEYNPYSMLIADKNGNVLKVNKQFVDFFKTEPPSGYTIFNDPNIKKYKVEELMNKLKKGEKVTLPMIWFTPKDVHPSLSDVRVYMSTTIFPLKDKDGGIVNYIMIHRDLTQQKIAEDVLKEKIAELEKINKIMIGRELRMVELKEQIKKLKQGK